MGGGHKADIYETMRLPGLPAGGVGMKDNLMLLDTHVHTCQVSPCGKVPAKEMIELYKEAGYGGVIITDHYYKGT